MPPKKDKKKKKKKAANNEESVEAKYNQTLHKINSLKSELALRTEIARRSQATSSELRLRIKEANEQSAEDTQNKHEISTDLIRQYKSMQLDLSSKIKSLENQNALLNEQLSKVRDDLRKEKEEKAQIIKEKDNKIIELKYKVEHMETAYENILHDAFDLMDEKLDAAKLKWENEAINIQERNKKLLLQFGLNPLDF